MTGSPQRKARKPSDRTARGLLGVASMTDRITRPLLGKRGFDSGQVIARWSEIVGPDLASTTAPEQVRYDRGRKTGGTLHLRVSSGAAAALIQPQTPVIIDRVNAFLGPGAIGSIKVSQGPLPAAFRTRRAPPTQPLDDVAVATVSADLADMESGSVRAALARLGARLKART